MEHVTEDPWDAGGDQISSWFTLKVPRIGLPKIAVVADTPKAVINRVSVTEVVVPEVEVKRN